MVINEIGCIIHKNVEYKESKNGQTIWVCDDCEIEFIRFEDCGSGC